MDALIFTAWDMRPSFLTVFSSQSIDEAAPSPTGAHIERVNGQDTRRSARTSSLEIGNWYWALGFVVLCIWFFDAITARSSIELPYFFICFLASWPYTSMKGE